MQAYGFDGNNRIYLWKWLIVGCLIVKPFIFYNLMDIRINMLFLWAATALILVLLFGSFKNLWIPYGLYAAFTILMFCDVTFNAYFNGYLPVNAAGSAKYLGDVLDVIKEVVRPEFGLLFLDLPLLAVAVVGARRRGAQFFNVKWLPKTILIWMVSLLILGSVSLSLPLRSAGNLEFFSVHIKDVLQASTGFGDRSVYSGSRSFYFLTKEERENRLFGIARDKNLIVIQMESLQNFVINREYEGQEITPVLNSLIREDGSLYFDRYYMQIAAGNTSDAEFATHNSLYGSDKSYTYELYKENTFRGLPVLLKEIGYSTIAMHGYDGSFWSRGEMYPIQGFDTFIDGEGYDPSEIQGWGILDEEFYIQSVDYLKEQPQPFYSFLVSLTNHTPFFMEKKHSKLKLLKEHRDTRFGNYLNSTAYSDYALGALFDALKEAGLYENSIIAIYGDHFGLSEKDDDNEELMSEFLGKSYRFDEMANIPLIIHIPGERINGTLSVAGGHLDFLPTMAFLMGFTELDTIHLGQNLITAETGFVAQSRYAHRGSFITDDIAFLMSVDGVFENGTAWVIDTGEEIPLDGLRDLSERSAALIAASERYLEEDYIATRFAGGENYGAEGLENEDISRGGERLK